jgi:hypothetical protein
LIRAIDRTTEPSQSETNANRRQSFGSWALRPSRAVRAPQGLALVGLLTSEPRTASPSRLIRPCFQAFPDNGVWKRSNVRSVTAAGPFRSHTGFPVRRPGRRPRPPPTLGTRSR